MRRFVLLMVAAGCVACTQPNPAFDGTLADAQSGTEDPGDGDPGDGDGDGETGTTEGTEPDLPPDLVCKFEPSAGLAIALGDPNYFGGQCPIGVNVFARVLAVEGGEATLAYCGPGCTQCSAAQPLSAYPMTITDYLPSDADACLAVETGTLLGDDGSRCYWGAISIRDAVFEWPYVLATSRSAPPTPYAASLLAELIPEPLDGGACDCDAIDLGNECCYAGSSPSFWYYPFAGMQLFAGDYAQIDIANQNDWAYYFKVYQAEWIASCEADELRLSWAVVNQM